VNAHGVVTGELDDRKRSYPVRERAVGSRTSRAGTSPDGTSRYGLSYRDVEELLAERGIEVDHVTIYRWVHRFTPLLIDAARPCRHAPGDRWFVDETCALDHGSSPIEVSTDRAPAYPRVFDELVPAACHVTEQYGTQSKPITDG
jgi:hypothetical protein